MTFFEQNSLTTLKNGASNSSANVTDLVLGGAASTSNAKRRRLSTAHSQTRMLPVLGYEPACAAIVIGVCASLMAYSLILTVSAALLSRSNFATPQTRGGRSLSNTFHSVNSSSLDGNSAQSKSALGMTRTKHSRSISNLRLVWNASCPESSASTSRDTTATTFANEDGGGEAA